MKYFTLALWLADQEPDTPSLPDHPADAYRTYLASIEPTLPPHLRRLVSDICLHDGVLRRLDVQVADGSVTLGFDAGNADMSEGRRVLLRYQQVISLNATSDPELYLSGPHGFGSVGFDELELLSDGGFEHRLLFSSGIELAVRFGGFHLTLLDSKGQWSTVAT